MPPFDEAASAALTLAQAEARSFGHHFVGTEHLLLALADVASDGTEAARILTSLGTDTATVRAAVHAVVAAGDPGRDIPLHLTPRARLAVDIAARYAGRLEAAATGTGHLLYGLAAEREGLAAKVLLRHGATPAAVDKLILVPSGG